MNLKSFLKENLNIIYKPLYNLKRHYTEYKFREIKKSYGKKNPDKTFYIIRNMDYKTGLMSYYVNILQATTYAKEKGYIPIIDMCNYRNTYLDDSKIRKENSWEYYFKQPSTYTLEEAYDSKNVILQGNEGYPDYGVFDLYDKSKWSTYRLFDIASRDLALNKETEEKVAEAYARLFGNKKNVLGVICRGTDLINAKNHSIQPTVEELITRVKTDAQKWNCDGIFVASDTDKAIEKFKTEFGDKLIYNEAHRFDDWKKYNDGSNSLGDVRFERKDDARLRGLEYLISLQLLAKCNYLVGTKVGASFGAIIFNGGKYQDIDIIDLGKYQ